MFDDEDDVIRAGSIVDGRFTLEQPLGRGASGVVWSALDAASGQKIALKIMHRQLSEDPGAAERMAREAAVLTRLVHPNIARPVAFVARPERTYLAMELVDGAALHECMAGQDGQPFGLPVVARIFGELCSAVAYAHSQGVVHRDLKPQNVMVQQRGGSLFVKVLDFGVAKILEDSALDGTTQGRTIGSLFYLSPEQSRGDPATTASDVFALGSMLFELLTLRRMWAQDRQGRALQAFTVPLMSDGVNDVASVVDRIMRGPRARPSDYRPELPRELDRLVARATARDPGERPARVELLRSEALELLGGNQETRIEAEPVERTAVQPRRLEEHEELATEGRAVHYAQAPTVPTALPVITDAPVPTVTRPLVTLPAASEDEAAPTALKTLLSRSRTQAVEVSDVIDERSVVATRAGSVTAPGVLPPRGTSAPMMAPPAPPRASWLRPAGAVLAAAALVLVTFLATRAAYEKPQTVVMPAPVAPAPIATPGVVAHPAVVAAGAPEGAGAAAAGAQGAGDGAAAAAGAGASPSETAAAAARATAAPSRAPARPRETAAPSPSAPAAPRSELAGLLAAARAAPQDPARLAALSTAITRAAERVPDVQQRATIRRVAGSSAMVGNLAGLEQAYGDLSRALGAAGEPVP